MKTTVTRQDVAKVIHDYLNNGISRSEAHQWALKIVITKDFDRFRETDTLLSEAIHALFDLHHEGEDQKYNPTMEELRSLEERLRGG